MSSRFTIIVHEAERVLEVRYPPRPSLESWEQYVVEVKAIILELGKRGAWECLVDQTSLKALAPDFPPRIAEINGWARGHGMQRTARLVCDSAVGELQTLRILKEAGVKDMGAVFHERAAAWTFLTTP